MKYAFLGVSVLVLSAMVFSAEAQERTAAGAAMEAQVTWTALRSMLEGVRLQTQAAASTATDARDRVLKIEVCNTKLKLYAPTASGADAEGCASVTTPKQDWVDVSSQRVLKGVYRNTTGQPIVVMLDNNSQPFLQVSKDGVNWLSSAMEVPRSNNWFFSVTLVVPDGYYYRLQQGHPQQAATFMRWLELR